MGVLGRADWLLLLTSCVAAKPGLLGHNGATENPLPLTPAANYTLEFSVRPTSLAHCKRLSVVTGNVHHVQLGSNKVLLVGL